MGGPAGAPGPRRAAVAETPLPDSLLRRDRGTRAPLQPPRGRPGEAGSPLSSRIR